MMNKSEIYLASILGEYTGTLPPPNTKIEIYLYTLAANSGTDGNTNTPPTVTVSINPSKTVYDIINESISSITMSASVGKRTNDITKVEFYVNNALVHSVVDDVTSGGVFPYTYNTTIADDVTFKVVVTDSEGLEGSTSKKIDFVANSYYGIISADIDNPTEVDIKNLNKVLKTSKSYVYSGITTDWGKVCYAYPAEFGPVVSIEDEINAFNYTNSFTISTTTVDGIEYNVYTQIDPSAATNIELTFA